MQHHLGAHDFTEENGATRVVPGSNVREDKLTFALDDTEPAEMARAAVLFYSGSVYHGGGPNRSDATRIGLNITYNVAWLRQEENQYLSVPRRGGRDAADGPAPADGVRPRRVRAGLHRRPARSD